MRTALRGLTLIQARMGSERLPGKALADLGGKTVLERVIDRVREADLGRFVVATSTLSADDAIETHVTALGVPCFRGSPGDVLRRFVCALDRYGGDYVIRVTADCPFLDPGLLRAVSGVIASGRFDYVGVKGAPDGLHQEAITEWALRISEMCATRGLDREHVVTYALARPEVFRVGWVEADMQGEPCMLDTPEDLERLRGMAA